MPDGKADCSRFDVVESWTPDPAGFETWEALMEDLREEGLVGLRVHIEPTHAILRYVPLARAADRTVDGACAVPQDGAH